MALLQSRVLRFFFYPAREGLPGAFMQQRQLRLGDILDDYCPRERRITNHAVVAKIDDEVRQTRCLTCDTEHEFRQGKAPTLRKKKDNVGTAYREVLAEVTKGAPDAVAADAREVDSEPAEAAAEPAPEAAGLAAAEAAGNHLLEPPTPAEGGEGAEEEGRVHRRLIRATLPRPENQAVTRPIPQFTMRQPTGRPTKFRPTPARGPRAAAGARVAAASGGRSFPSRGGAPQHAARPGRVDGPRAARGAPHPRHGKKHSK